jgi:prophage regulatory protein
MEKTLSSFDDLPESGFIRQAQLIPHVVPFSSATLWRRCAKGLFPKPVRLSERVTAWRVGDVRDWLDNQRTVRGADAAKGGAR